MSIDEISKVHNTLQKFQDGYTTRDKSKLDEFIESLCPYRRNRIDRRGRIRAWRE